VLSGTETGWTEIVRIKARRNDEGGMVNDE
jgi:hypothetical protein